MQIGHNPKDTFVPVIDIRKKFCATCNSWISRWHRVIAILTINYNGIINKSLILAPYNLTYSPE